MSWLTPNDSVADLRDFLDKRHGSGGWSYRSTPHTGTDCIPALHDAMDYLRTAYGRGVIRITGYAGFRFGSPISTDKLRGMTIRGENSDTSRMFFDMNGGVMFQYTGGGGFTGGGLENLKVFLESDHPNSTVYGLVLQGDATFQPDDMIFRNVYFATVGNSYYYSGIMVYGNARPTSPQGIRVVRFEDVQVFRCRSYACYFSNLVQGSVDNLGSYSGLDYGNDIYITGNTTGCDFRRVACNGDLHLNHCQIVDIRGSAARIIADAGSTSHMSGVLNGPLYGGFGANSAVTVLG